MSVSMCFVMCNLAPVLEEGVPAGSCRGNAAQPIGELTTSTAQGQF